jgi:hypothetical protein
MRVSSAGVVLRKIKEPVGVYDIPYTPTGVVLLSVSTSVQYYTDYINRRSVIVPSIHRRFPNWDRTSSARQRLRQFQTPEHGRQTSHVPVGR